MGDLQVAVAYAPAKRKSKNWVRESTRDLSIECYVKKLTTERRITTSKLKSGKEIWKYFNYSRFKYTTMLRAFHDMNHTQVFGR